MTDIANIFLSDYNGLPKNTTAILSGKKWNLSRIRRCVSRMQRAVKQ